jgi:hypothetical protein
MSSFRDGNAWTQAIHGPFQDKWWDAMNTKINTLENDLQAWELVKRDETMKNILPSTWAFKIKRFPDGLVLTCVEDVVSMQRASSLGRRHYRRKNDQLHLHLLRNYCGQLEGNR